MALFWTTRHCNDFIALHVLYKNKKTEQEIEKEQEQEKEQEKNKNNNNNQSSLVIWEERISTPHGRECTPPLRVLAVQCPLQTSQPWTRYIHTTSVPQHISSNLYPNPNPTYHTNPTSTAG